MVSSGSLGGGLTHHTVRGVLWMSSGKAAYAVMQLSVLAVLGRVLTPAEFGVVSAALVVIAFSGIVSQLGLGPALVQRADLEPRHVHTAAATSVLTGLLLGATLWLAAPLAAEFFKSPTVTPVLRALALVFPLQGLGIVAESLARRELQFRWLAQLDAKAYGLGYGLVALPLALSGYGVWSLVLGEIAEAGLRTLLLLYRFRPPLGLRPERRALLELLQFGGGFTVAKLANFFAVRGDNLVVGHVLGPAALGIYGRAYQLMSAPMNTFGTVLDHALFPAMARVQRDTGRIAAAYRRGTTLMALLIVPATGMFVLLAPEIIHVLLGPRWSEVVAPFRILAIAMLFQNNSKIGDALARALGAVYRRAWRQILYASLVLTGSYVGQHWGVAGVAVGVAIAIGLNFLFMSHLSLRLTRLTWLDLLRVHVPGVLLAVVCSLVGLLTAGGLRSSGAAPAVVLIATVGAMLVGALASIRCWPAVFLGSDAAWILETVRGFAPRWLGRLRLPARAAVHCPPKLTGVI